MRKREEADVPTLQDVISDGRTVVFNLLAAIEQLEKARETEAAEDDKVRGD